MEYMIWVGGHTDRLPGGCRSELADFLAHRGTEEYSLHLSIDHGHDLLNLSFEPQLQQFISLIEDNHLQIFHPHTPGVHQHVDNPTRSTNY